MRVTFFKLTERRLTYWEAVRARRTVVPGSHMALGRGGMPHDLLQFVVEAATGTENGFWGCVAQGATFRSTGRKRTRPGKAIIAANRDGLKAAEALAGRYEAEWQRGRPSEVSDALTKVDAVWNALPDEGSFTIEWPTLCLTR